MIRAIKVWWLDLNIDALRYRISVAERKRTAIKDMRRKLNILVARRMRLWI
jgi:hypothetical protein